MKQLLLTSILGISLLWGQKDYLALYIIHHGSQAPSETLYLEITTTIKDTTIIEIYQEELSKHPAASIWADFFPTTYSFVWWGGIEDKIGECAIRRKFLFLRKEKSNGKTHSNFQ